MQNQSSITATGSLLALTLATFSTLSQVARADLALDCQIGGSRTPFTSYDLYVQCGDLCDCQAYEILCIDIASDFSTTLETKSFVEAESCATNECLCNSNDASWNELVPILHNGVSYPERRLFPVPKPAALQAAAAAFPDSYEAKLLADLQGRSETPGVIPHELNTELLPENEIPGFYFNRNTAEFTSENCATTVNCDLFYQPDWGFEVQASVTCSEAIAGDACFGTFACACDNGYYRVSESMPEFEESETMRFTDVVQYAQPRENAICEGECEYTSTYAESTSAPADPVVVKERQPTPEYNISVEEEKARTDFTLTHWILVISLAVVCFLLLVWAVCKYCFTRNTDENKISVEKIEVEMSSDTESQQKGKAGPLSLPYKKEDDMLEEPSINSASEAIRDTSSNAGYHTENVRVAIV